MLGQAVRAYRTQRPEQPVPAAQNSQHRFASHLAGSPPQGLQHALQPSVSVALNGAQNRPMAGSDGVKRKADDVGAAEPVAKAARGADSTGVLNKLHGGVFFDENDFVDDADIDLDEDSPLPPSLPALQPLKPPSPLKMTTPTPKPTNNSSMAYPPIATSQVDWSSSPLEHFRAPARSLGQEPAPAIDLTQTDEEPVRPAKRRQLPWQKKTPRPAPQMSVIALPANAVMTQTTNGSSADPVSYPALPQETPVTKARTDPSYPWNKTASAMKEEQRSHRLLAQSKRSQKDGAIAAEEDRPKPKPRTAGGVQDKNARVFLSPEQEKVLQLISEGKKSVFFTGSAGTGKSVLMREIIQVLKKRYAREADRVAVTASTGLAACNIGGVTLHSFAGIGLGKEPVEHLVKKIKKNAKARQRWLRTKVLIVDEISMVDGGLFDKLEEIARIVRNNGRPFGGIQLVITGDFFQLPPVPDRTQAAKFAFDAATWTTSIQHTIGLTHVFRQKDPEFASILNEMRLGKLTDKSIIQFKSLARSPDYTDGIEPTELFPTRNEVDRANETRMRSLPGDAMEFRSIDGGTMQDTARRTDLLQNCMAPEKLILKMDSQVMLIKNMDATLVNGAIGKVIALMDEKAYEYARERGEVDTVGEARELIGEGDPRSRIGAMSYKGGITTGQKYPLVQFQLADGTTRELLCVREMWKIEQPNGEVVASRSQVPLIPAWALSIHKAQGQTLDRVRVDLGKIFEKGQAYVALSRATTQEGLQILRFDPKKVMAHEKVRKFYDGLASLGEAKTEPAKPQAPARPAGVPNDSLFLDDDYDDSFADSNF